VAEVLSKITSGVLAVGQQLPNEAVMAAEFGVSRPLLREALSQLRAEGFIETVNGRGSFVRHPSEDDLIDSFGRQAHVSVASLPGLTVDHLYEARSAIETVAAESAAKRGTPEMIEALERLLQSMRDSRDDPAAYTASDVGFHVAVARASGNPLLPALLAPLAAMIVQGVFESHGASRAVSGGVADHEKILRAIKRKDPAGARAAMSAHLRGSRQLFPKEVIEVKKGGGG
jgi:GntR family transcriptional repressor for pyruvate dehydrogenase complex